MFKDKILVGVGCSFTNGTFEDDTDNDSMHSRSWVKKLEKLGNFDNSVNLALGGASNQRSERVLFNFLKKDKRPKVVIFAITELSRFESINVLGLVKEDFCEVDGDIAYQTESSFRINIPADDKTTGITILPDAEKIKYLKYYYKTQSSDKTDNDIINRRVAMMHCFLKLLNIEHYFLEMSCIPGSIEENQFGFKIPMIYFYSPSGDKISGVNWMTDRFTPGYCKHFDSDANYSIAEYMFNYIKDKKYE